MVSSKVNTHGFPIGAAHTNQYVAWIFGQPIASIQSMVNGDCAAFNGNPERLTKVTETVKAQDS